MPDGFGGAPLDGVAVDQRAGWLSKISAFLFGSRTRVLAFWAISATLLFAAAAGYVIVRRVALLNAADAYAYSAAASCLIWLPLFALLLDPSANLATGPRLRLPIVTMLMLTALCAIVIAAPRLGFGNLLESAANRVAFFCFLAMPFVLRMWNAANFAKHKARNRRSAEQVAKTEAQQDALAGRSAPDVNQQIEQHKNAESLSALLGSVVVVAIVVGAYVIGTMPAKDASLGANLGVGIFVGVVSLFAVVVFLDPIADLPVIRSCAALCNKTARSFGWLASFYNGIDSGLVRIGAHVAGADHREWYSRYAVLGGTLVCLAVLGFYLPAPLGLAPVGIGLVVALSMSRLWSWVEEDRNLASITQFNPLAPQRVGFREDFRDETILGFAFVLILLPIGLMQAHKSNVFGPLFEPVSGKGMIDPNNWSMWLGYFGFELAKALPIVDWADIYNLGPGGDSIQPVHPFGQHAVFMARAMVDLILIAALLQAIGIANRNRQQKMLYASDQIDRLDELVEKVELKKSVGAAEVGEGVFDPTVPAKAGLIDFGRYNEERLKQIYASSDERSKRRAFIAAIFQQRGLTADPAIITLQNIAASHRNELDLIRVYELAKRDHERGVHRIEVTDIQPILFDIRNSSGMREFKQELIKLATTLGAPNELLSMLSSIAVGPQRDQFQYARLAAARAIIEAAPKVTSVDEIVETLALFEKERAAAFGAQQGVANEAEGALKARLSELGVPKP